MSLRIAWLGPWSEQSAIAAFGLQVVSELESRGGAVTVYRSEIGNLLALPPLPGERPVSELTSSKTRELLTSFDYVIANVGDHFGFHGAILPILPELGATVIFHDGFIANLVAGYISANSKNLETHKTVVRLTHGADAIPDRPNVWDAPLEVIAAERPMTEWLARLAAGCVTHSGLWLDRFRKSCVGPIQIIPLCYPDLGVPEPSPIGDALTLSTVGYINPNKQADQVLKALASDPILASRCRYQLLGQITSVQRDRISKLAETLGVPEPHFSGRLSDSDLREALAETDVISCLRHPILEGGSASFITALFSARPTLVSHQAHYAEVPNGLVLPCRPGEEAADVARHLRWILDNPEKARAMGLRAQQYALATHVSDRYVDKLLDLAARATEVSPVVRAAVRSGQVLGSFGADISDPAAERIARTLSSGLPN